MSAHHRPGRPAGLRFGLAAAVSVLALWPSQVRAHAIESSLERLMDLQGDVGAEAGADLRLQSRFSNGEPTRDATVRLLPPDGGEPLEVGRTDASGSLSFSLPSDLDGSWEIQVDGGPGHRDYLEMPVEGRQPQLDRLVEKPATLRLPHLAGGGAVLALVGLLGGGLVRLRRP